MTKVRGPASERRGTVCESAGEKKLSLQLTLCVAYLWGDDWAPGICNSPGSVFAVTGAADEKGIASRATSKA